jgi:uncharacterized membrane protein YgcG
VDAQVLDALCSIFRAMAAAPAADPRQAAQQAQQAQHKAQPRPLRRQGSGLEARPGWVVDLHHAAVLSPNRLREALHALGTGVLRMSEMQDASEVLGEMLDRMHRAEARARTPHAELHDITLPRRIRLPAPLPASGGEAGAAPLAATEAAAAAPRAPGTVAGSPAPGSTVHRLVGLDVQEPCISEGREEEEGRRSQGAARSQGRKASSSGSSSSQPGGGAVGSGGGSGTGQAEVLRYTKFFHLVPAQSEC